MGKLFTTTLLILIFAAKAHITIARALEDPSADVALMGEVDPAQMWYRLHHFSCSEIGVQINTVQAPVWYFTALSDDTLTVTVEARNGERTWIRLTHFPLGALGDNWTTLKPWILPNSPWGTYFPTALVVTDGRSNTVGIHYGATTAAYWAVICGRAPHQLHLPLIVGQY